MVIMYGTFKKVRQKKWNKKKERKEERKERKEQSNSGIPKNTKKKIVCMCILNAYIVFYVVFREFNLIKLKVHSYYY